MGDVWLFVALAATQKAVLNYVMGKRDTDNGPHEKVRGRF